MRHLGLKIRMAIVGVILAAFYLVAVAAAMVVFGTGIWPIAILGSILLIGVQYKVGKWAALRSVGAEDMPEQQYSYIHQRVEQLSREMGIETGDPAEVIVAYIDETDVDHIVMGGHGGDNDGLVSRLLGTVATKVVSEAPVTVTVVR